MSGLGGSAEALHKFKLSIYAEASRAAWTSTGEVHAS